MRNRHPAPGRLLPIDPASGRRLHVRFEPGPRPGEGPTVVLESALGGSSLGWVFVEPALRAHAATFAYDRAGLGWSDGDPRPRGLDEMVDDLGAALRAAGAPAPYILVGHSYGALIVREFAARQPEVSAGLMLLDPPALGEWCEPDEEHRRRLDTGIRLARRGMWAARCGIAQLAAWLIAAGAFRLAAAAASAVSTGKLRPRGDFNFTPAAKLPPELKPVMRWMWTRPRFYAALAQQMEALSAACRQVAALPGPADLPLAVLSAADTPTAQSEEQQRLAAASRRGWYGRAPSGGHWIPLEAPEFVTRQLVELLAASGMLKEK